MRTSEWHSTGVRQRVGSWACLQRIAGEIKEFSYDGYVNAKMAKRMDKFMWYLLTAGKRALEDAGMTSSVLEGLDKQKCGILIGSAMGGMQVSKGRVSKRARPGPG